MSKITDRDRAAVASVVSDAMKLDLPADDELVAAAYSAYEEAVAAGELEVDSAFELQCKLHLKGTSYERSH